MNDDRFRDLSDSLEKLSESVRFLEGRVAALESVESVPAVPASPSLPDELDTETPVEEFGFSRPSATRVFFLLGQSIVFLGGAFLLRALNQGGTLPPMVGFLVGLAYALTLMFLSDRALGKGDEGGATAIGITAAVVAFPFLYETTSVLNVISPMAGGLVLVVISVVALGSAWRRSVRVLSWVYSMAIMATILALGFATGAAEFYAALLLVLGLVTMLMAYAKKWHFKRWVVAFAANLIIYRLTVLATNPPTVGSGKQILSLPVVQALAIALVVL